MKTALSDLARRFPRVATFPATDFAPMPLGVVTLRSAEVIVMAGPCAVESERQIMQTAESVARDGARVLRGGAFKPRSSPYSFQGMGEEGLKLLRKAGDAFGLSVVTEVMAKQDIELVASYADIMQVGSRSMENFELLEALGPCPRPVLLKRGLSSTIEELLASAQVLVDSGNSNVMLCERGIRTFETCTRNTLDINGVAVLKAISKLPVIVDPSHAIGIRDLVPVLARAAVVAGADGLIVEVHPKPEEAFSDGDQSLHLEQFGEMMRDLRGYIALRAQHSCDPVGVN